MKKLNFDKKLIFSVDNYDYFVYHVNQVERDTEEWKAKFEDSQELVKKMNYQNLNREKEADGMKRKLAAMEKLNRHLSQERTSLLKQVAEFETKQPNGDSTVDDCCDKC